MLTLLQLSHVTHLWLQSVFLDQIEITQARISPEHRNNPSSVSDKQALWDQREDICRQLLNVLRNTPQASLEANSLALRKKVREIAAVMIHCPFDAQSPVVRRSKMYVQDLANILSKLDGIADIPETVLDGGRTNL